MSISGRETPRYALRGFVTGSRPDGHWSKSSPHGWGIACYPEGRRGAFILKEPKPARESVFVRVAQEGHLPKSDIHILHIRRRSSTGEPALHVNTHPFARLVGGKEYVFAHNGGLKGYNRAFPLRHHFCLGGTTSEHAFCSLLERNADDLAAERWDQVLATLRQMNQYGHLNCLLSDGDVLLAYYDREGYKGLHFVERHPPYPEIRLQDEDSFRVDTQLSQEASRRAYVIATRPLTLGEPWQELPRGGLLVFRRGELIWRSDAAPAGEGGRVPPPPPVADTGAGAAGSRAAVPRRPKS